MQSDQLDNETHGNKPKTIAGRLLSGLEMEDVMAHSVYQDYMDRKNWPDKLNDEVFDEIRNHLKTLIDDAVRHRNIRTRLISKLDKSYE